MVAELVDTPTSRLTDRRRPAVAPSHHSPRRAERRVERRLPLGGGSGWRPAAAVGAAVRPAPASVNRSATRAPGLPSCGPRRVADRRAALRRRRAGTVGALAVVIVFSWMATRTALGRTGGGPLATTGAPGGGRPAAVRVWVVRPGDTLWSIAEAVDPNGDVRPLVDRLAAETRSSAIYPGEAIPVPGR